jgi:hypothetical protein
MYTARHHRQAPSFNTSAPPWRGKNPVKTDGTKSHGVVVCKYGAKGHCAVPCAYGANGHGAVLWHLSRGVTFLPPPAASFLCRPVSPSSAGPPPPARSRGRPPPLPPTLRPYPSPARAPCRPHPKCGGLVRRWPDPAGGELAAADAALTSASQGETLTSPLPLYFCIYLHSYPR